MPTARTMPHVNKLYVGIRLSLSSRQNGQGASSSISRCSTLDVGILGIVHFALQQSVVVGTAFLKKRPQLHVPWHPFRHQAYKDLSTHVLRQGQPGSFQEDWLAIHIYNFSIQRLPIPHCCNETKCTTLEPKKIHVCPNAQRLSSAPRFIHYALTKINIDCPGSSHSLHRRHGRPSLTSEGLTPFLHFCFFFTSTH